jgi:hypothetical protein
MERIISLLTKSDVESTDGASETDADNTEVYHIHKNGLRVK